MNEISDEDRRGAEKLAVMLPFKITGLIQYGETKSMWELVLDDGSVIDAGSTSSLLECRWRSRLMLRLFERPDVLLTRELMREWRDNIRLLLRSVKKEHRERSEYRRKYGR